MRDRRVGLTLLILAATTLGTLGVAAAQQRGNEEPPARADDAKNGKKDAKGKVQKGGLRVPFAAPPKNQGGNAPDPLAQARQARAAAKGNGNANAKAAPAAGQAPVGPVGPPKWPFHYTMKIKGADSTPLSLSYYPAQKPFEAPVLMLLHETGRGRSGRDFQDPVQELKKGFATHLQEQGYAVIVPDLRGHGANARHDLAPAEWRAMPADLQAVYLFLVDRHNRGELNLGKFGVVALGDAGNLAVAWAVSSGGAVSSPGRISDLSAIVIISPVADAHGLVLERLLPPITPRVPMLLASGVKDKPSSDTTVTCQPIIERHQRSRTAFFQTTLHGAKLLNFFPKVAKSVESFLDDPVKFRSSSWEPRYLLDPIQYGNISLVADSGYLSLPAVNANANNANAAGANAKNANAPAVQKGGAAVKKR